MFSKIPVPIIPEPELQFLVPVPAKLEPEMDFTTFPFGMKQNLVFQKSFHSESIHLV